LAHEINVPVSRCTLRDDVGCLHRRRDSWTAWEAVARMRRGQGVCNVVSPWVLAVVCGLAFWMGYSVNQSGTCAVATAHELLQRRRPRRLAGLLAASAVAALVAASLAWLSQGGAQVASVIDISPWVLAGAVVFGVGALVNDTCLLGSLGRLGNGELRMLALPLGLAVGFAAASAVTPDIAKTLRPSILAHPSTVAWLGLGAWSVVLVAALAVAAGRPHHQPPAPRWPLGLSMVVLGASGGALFATAPLWSYAQLIQRSLPLSMSANMGDPMAMIAVAATVAGALAAAHRRRSWRPRRPTTAGLGRSLLGGALMGLGAALIPGGNDGLVLAAIPALSPGGAVAYVVMTLTIVIGLWGQARLRGLRGRAYRKVQPLD